MKNYNGRWIDLFNLEIHAGEKKPKLKGKIVLETPSIDYILTREQFEELKKKVNDFDY